MDKQQCTNCLKHYPAWASYKVPKGNGFTFPGRGKKIKPDKNICGSCASHAKDAGAIKPQFYKRLVNNQMEKR